MRDTETTETDRRQTERQGQTDRQTDTDRQTEKAAIAVPKKVVRR